MESEGVNPAEREDQKDCKKQAEMQNKARASIASKRLRQAGRQARSICHLHIHVRTMTTTRSGSGK